MHDASPAPKEQGANCRPSRKTLFPPLKPSSATLAGPGESSRPSSGSRLAGEPSQDASASRTDAFHRRVRCDTNANPPRPLCGVNNGSALSAQARPQGLAARKSDD